MAQADRVGVGLIGCGMIGQVHADGLAKLAADGEVRQGRSSFESQPALDVLSIHVGSAGEGPPMN